MTASLLCAPAVAQDKSINVMIWGVTWQTAIEPVSKEFEAKTGIKVNFVTQASSGEGLVKLQAMRDNPTVDVWFTTASLAARATQDKAMFAPLPKADIPNLSELAEGAAAESSVGIYAYPMSIIYRTDLVKGEINQWSDLWKPEFKGKLAVPAMGMYQGRMLWIASTQGQSATPDFERGFDELKKLKPNVSVFYSSDAQARQSLAQGEVVAIVAPPSQGKRVADAGRPVRIVSPRFTPMNQDVMTIVKSGKEALAAQYIDYLLSAAVNETVAGTLGISPVNTKSKHPAALAEALPKSGDGVNLDEAMINANIPAWIERFNNQIVR
jgi:spermidine/putrescine-binding protein